MSDVTGIQRLRQAIDNQSAAGEACFSLPAGEAYAICDEVEDELARVSWAQRVPAPVDADGEVVEGVQAFSRQPEFKIEMKEDNENE